MTSDQTSSEGILLTEEQIEKLKQHHKTVMEWGQALFRGWHPGATDIVSAGEIMGDILGDLALEVGVIGYDDKHRVSSDIKDIYEWEEIRENKKKNKKEVCRKNTEEESEDDE